MKQLKLHLVYPIGVSYGASDDDGIFQLNEELFRTQNPQNHDGSSWFEFAPKNCTILNYKVDTPPQKKRL